MTDLGSGGCWVESVGPEGGLSPRCQTWAVVGVGWRVLDQKVFSSLDDRPGQWWVLGGECWTRRCTEGVLTPR